MHANVINLVDLLYSKIELEYDANLEDTSSRYLSKIFIMFQQLACAQGDPWV